MKSYHNNIIYAVLCWAFAFYMARNALRGDGGTLTYVSAALVAVAGLLFLGTYLRQKKAAQDESDEKENP